MFRRVLPYAVVGCAAGLILGLGAMNSPPEDEPRGVPSLRLDRWIQRLPPAPPGTHVMARFTLHNDGTGPLRLSYLQSSCGCVEAQLSRTEVPPGESAELRAEVLVPSVGRRESKIQFFTNSDAREPVTISVVAQSDVPLPYVRDESDPGVVFNGWLTVGMSRNVAVRTVEKPGSPPWLRRFETNLACVSVELLEVEESPSADEPGEIEREYCIELSLVGELPAGRLEGRLMAFADEEDLATILGPVLVDPADPVELYPSAVYLTSDAADAPQTVYLRSMQPNFDLECSVEEPLPGGVEVRLAEQERGMHEFLISFADAGGGQATTGRPARWEVVFLTNHPEMPRVVLPVVLRR